MKWQRKILNRIGVKESKDVNTDSASSSQVSEPAVELFMCGSFTKHFSHLGNVSVNIKFI